MMPVLTQVLFAYFSCHVDDGCKTFALNGRINFGTMPIFDRVIDMEGRSNGNKLARRRIVQAQTIKNGGSQGDRENLINHRPQNDA